MTNFASLESWEKVGMLKGLHESVIATTQHVIN